jgi:hypothetical protein
LQDENSVPEASPRVLFLDDDPARAEEFLARHPQAVWVQTAGQCIARLAECWDEVHLDHDLGGEIFVDPAREDCGMEVVRWLCRDDRSTLRARALFVVHTHNMNAAGTMVRSLREAGYLTVYRPFGIDLESWLADRDGEEDEEPDDETESGEPSTEPVERSASGGWSRWLIRLIQWLASSPAARSDSTARCGAEDRAEPPSDSV